MKIKTKPFGIEGRYTYKMVDRETGEVELEVTEPRENLVLDALLSKGRSWLTDDPYLVVGDGDHPDPLPTDTALGNQVAQFVYSGYVSNSHVGEEDGYVISKVSHTHKITGINANLTELGIRDGSGGDLLTKTKFKDALGNVTTVQVADNKDFFVTYETIVYTPIVLATGTFETPHGSSDYIYRVPTNTVTNASLAKIIFGAGWTSNSSLLSLITNVNNISMIDRNDYTVDGVNRTAIRNMNYAYQTVDKTIKNYGNNELTSQFSATISGERWPYMLFLKDPITIPAGYGFGFSFEVKWGRVSDVIVEVDPTALDQQRVSQTVMLGSIGNTNTNRLTRTDFNGTTTVSQDQAAGNYLGFVTFSVDKIALMIGGRDQFNGTDSFYVKIDETNTVTSQANTVGLSDTNGMMAVGFDTMGLMYGGVNGDASQHYSTVSKIDAQAAVTATDNTITDTAVDGRSARLANNGFYTHAFDSSWATSKKFKTINTNMTVVNSGAYTEDYFELGALASAHNDSAKVFAYGARGNAAIEGISDFRTYGSDGVTESVESAVTATGMETLQGNVVGARVTDGSQARAVFYGGDQQTGGGIDLINSTLMHVADTKVVVKAEKVFASSDDGYQKSNMGSSFV